MMAQSRDSFSVIVADDHPIVLKGMQELLGSEHGIELIGACNDGRQALKIIAEQSPDVAVLDVRMPRLSGIEVLRAVHTEGLVTRVVLLTAAISDIELQEAISFGLAGLVLKDSVPEELIQCVRTVASGSLWIPVVNPSDMRFHPGAAGPEDDAPPLRGLTEREREIAVLVSRGLPNKAIAQRLGVTGGTVKIHLHNIYRKLGLSNRASLAAYAVVRSDLQTQEGPPVARRRRLLKFTVGS